MNSRHDVRWRAVAFLAAALLAPLLSAGCGSESEEPYYDGVEPEPDPSIVSESPAPPAVEDDLLLPPAGEPDAEVELPPIEVDVAGIRVEVPPTWQIEPPASSMRAAQFAIPLEGGGEATVAFYDDIGGTVEDNIGRWINQIADPTTEPQRSTFQSNGLTIHTLAINGSLVVPPMMGGSGQPEPGTALWGAVIEGGPQGNIFIKATGPEDGVERHGGAWEAVLRSAYVPD